MDGLKQIPLSRDCDGLCNLLALCVSAYTHAQKCMEGQI